MGPLQASAPEPVQATATIIDCCTREIVGWSLELRCRTEEAIELVDHALAVRGIEPGWLTLGTDNGSAFTSRRFRENLAGHGV